LVSDFSPDTTFIYKNVPRLEAVWTPRIIKPRANNPAPKTATKHYTEVAETSVLFTPLRSFSG
jgi:hypothetical protein